MNLFDKKVKKIYESFDSCHRVWQGGFENLSIGDQAVSKEKLGVKRLCESCGTKFYDLNCAHIICPKCETKFIPQDGPSKVPVKGVVPADGGARASVAGARVDGDTQEVDLEKDNTVSFDDLIKEEEDDDDDDSDDESNIKDLVAKEFGDDIDAEIDADIANDDVTIIEDEE